MILNHENDSVQSVTDFLIYISVNNIFSVPKFFYIS